MKQKLTYKLVKSNSINDRDINRMYSLMQENYDFILLENFKKDLIKKDYIGLLIDNNMTIQGFTTYAFNPNNYSNKKYNILFSGDTVISENFTGTQELTTGWGKTVGFFIKKYPDSDYAIDLKFKKDLIQNQLAAKELFVAKYYISVQKWVPAINRLKIILK